MIDLYNKDYITSLEEEKDVYRAKLKEISIAAAEAIEYADSVIVQLEEGNEEARIAEIEKIKTKIIDDVKANENAVTQEISKLMEEAARNDDNHRNTNAITVENLREALAAVQPPSNAVMESSGVVGAANLENKVARIKLKKEHIIEDAEELIKSIESVTAESEMSDS